MNKGFFKRWGEGIKKIPQEELLFSEMLGYSGSILGTIAAGFFFIFYLKSLWIISIPLFFNVCIQTSQLIGKYQQYKLMKDFKDKFKDLQCQVAR